MKKEIRVKAELKKEEIIILAENYDEKTKEVKYTLGNNSTDETKEILTEILGKSSSKEIISFNPIIKALEHIDSIKNIKYDKDNKKESIEEYKRSKKEISTFNSSLRETKSILKRPHIDYNKKIDKIFNVLSSEVSNTKTALDENYKEYLDEVKRKKEEAEKKKKEAELRKIAELTESNRKQQELLNNQKKVSERLEIIEEINAFYNTISVGLPHLNIGGLKGINTEFKTVIPDYFTDDDIQEFTNLIESKKKVVENTIELLKEKLSRESKEVVKEVIAPVKEVSIDVSDNEKMKEVLDLMISIETLSKNVFNKIEKVDFSEKINQEIKTIIINKGNEILDLNSKMTNWINTKIK